MLYNPGDTFVALLSPQPHHRAHRARRRSLFPIRPVPLSLTPIRSDQVEMDVPYGDIPFFLEPNAQVRNAAILASRRPAGANVSWTSKILPLHEVSDDVLKNKFFVETLFGNQEGEERTFSFILNGDSTIEEVCALSIYKLRENGWITYEPFGCVFHTVEEEPLLIPTGSLLGEIYKTNPNTNGTGVELSADVVEEEEGCCFIISPGDDYVLGHWITGLLAQ